MTFGGISIWDELRVETLKRLHALGNSASVIGAELGVSRNAVIGKANRLGLAQPPREIKIKAAKPRERKVMRIEPANAFGSFRIRESISAVEHHKLRCVEIIPQHVSLVDLEGCKYPYGDGPFTFCNHPQMKGSSYCVPHYHLTNKPPEPIRSVAMKRHGTDFARSA